MRKTLDYVILTGIWHGRETGYDLSRWLGQVASHFWLVGHSSVYPALAQLAEDALVEHRSVASRQGPDRKVYALTEQGRRQLLSWVQAPAAEERVRDEQVVHALGYGFLPTRSAVEAIASVRDRHAAKLAHYRELERRLRAGHGPDDEPHGFTEPAYIGELLAVRRGVLHELGYLQWCDEADAIVTGADQQQPDLP